MIDFGTSKVPKSTTLTTNRAIFEQYRSILADTDTKDSHSETNEVILEMEISAGKYRFYLKSIIDFKIPTH